MFSAFFISLTRNEFYFPDEVNKNTDPLLRHLLLRPAEHQEERLHRPAPEHAGLRLHAGAARPVAGHDEGQPVADQLVQQRPLPLPHQQLLTDQAGWVKVQFAIQKLGIPGDLKHWTEI